MIYTEMTRKAMKLAYDAHQGQTDKSGVPYIFHPIHLAEQMQEEDTAVCALLHDVVEDTPYTLADLADMGFPREVTDALGCSRTRKACRIWTTCARSKRTGSPLP